MGLTLAGCLATKDAWRVTYAQQLGVAASKIEVVCEEITTTRRRLQQGETIEVVIEYTSRVETILGSRRRRAAASPSIDATRKTEDR